MTQGFNSKPQGTTSTEEKSSPKTSPVKSEQSDPSRSIDVVNIPEVSSVVCVFTYNHFTRDERISPPKTRFSNGSNRPLDKVARYVTVSWRPPSRKTMGSSTTKSRVGTIAQNKESIISEDDSLNPDYVDHAFSDDESITRASTDLELYDRMTGRGNESLSSMAIDRLSTMKRPTESPNDQKLERVARTFMKVIDDPGENLGLTVTGSDPARAVEAIDDDDVTLHVKVHGSVVSDVFSDSRLKTVDAGLASIKVASARVRTGTRRPERMQLPIVEVVTSRSERDRLTRPVEVLGYVVTRYVDTKSGFKVDGTFYVEDPGASSLVDVEVLYSKTYVYAVQTVAAVEMLTREGDQVFPACMYVASRSIAKKMRTDEPTPPPEPTSPKFTYDFMDQRLTVHWDMPVNPQADVKQFQVLRRSSIDEPYELICQYSFDDTYVTPGSTERGRTGERVDGNSPSMSDEERSLVRYVDFPAFSHVDDDFYVDPETRESSRFIYAIASVDAHGLISNYSTQVEVTYDAYTNRLVSRVVCDAGAPRQYPNMTLSMDAFKDAVFVSGFDSRRMDVHLTPDFLKVKDPSRGTPIEIVAGSSPDRPSSFYVAQMINVDNQKTQVLRMEIKDAKRQTSPVKLGVPLNR